jgi:hypothetical protein
MKDTFLFATIGKVKAKVSQEAWEKYLVLGIEWVVYPVLGLTV